MIQTLTSTHSKIQSHRSEYLSATDLAALRTAAQERLFSTEDSCSRERLELVTAAWRAHAHEPMPVRRAMALRGLCEQGRIVFDPSCVFAGTTSEAVRSWVLFPEYGIGVDQQTVVELDGFDGFTDGVLNADEEEFWTAIGTSGGTAGPGHLAVDYRAVVRQGLEHIQGEIHSHTQGDPTVRRAMGIALSAPMSWARRYAHAAETVAVTETSRIRRIALRHLARACEQVPAKPARNLHEALQALILVHCSLVLEGQGTSLSIGRLDLILDDFSDEIAEDAERAAELIGLFLISIAANSYHGRSSKTQAITVGGPGVQPVVTRAVLEAFARTPVADPHLFLRWHRRIDGAVRDRAVGMLSSGRSMPLIVVDEQVIPGLVHCGIAPDDATDYAMVGCNEVGVPGVNWSVGISSGTYHDDMSLFMRAFASAPADADAEQVLQIWGSQLEDTLNGGIGRNHRWRTRMAAERPMPLTTALFRDGPRLAQDYVLLPGNEAVGTFTRGTANLVNALAALESLSHGPDAVDLGKLREALAQGDEPMLTRCLAAPKWGNDDPKVDQWMRRINELRLKICDSLAEKHRIPAVPVCHVVRSLHHVDGARIDASPDGRHAGESLADSIGAVCGTTDEGPTAILNSVLAVDPAAFKGVYNFNLSLVGAQGKPEVLGALIDAFIASGGQELQVAVLDPAKLREAQAHPEGFGDLVVRIAGLNARFVELSRREQGEVIKRAECA